MIKIDENLNVIDLTYKKLKQQDIRKLFNLNPMQRVHVAKISDVYGAYIMWINTTEQENLFGRALIPDLSEEIYSDVLYIIHESEFPTKFNVYNEDDTFDSLFYDIHIKSFLYKNLVIYKNNIGDFVLRDYVSYDESHNVFVYDIMRKFSMYKNKYNILFPLRNAIKNDGKKDILNLCDNIYVLKNDVLKILNELLSTSINNEMYEECSEIRNLINLYER